MVRSNYAKEGRRKGIRGRFKRIKDLLEDLFDYDKDEDYTIAITPVLSTKEPIDSLIMEDEHLDTISATESDKVIKSSVEELVLILSEFEGIFDVCGNVPLYDNPTPLKNFKDTLRLSSILNDDDIPK
ncbi:hypothetical protein Tco_0122685 [Tanacetum coccineum]